MEITFSSNAEVRLEQGNAKQMNTLTRQELKSLNFEPSQPEIE